MHPLITIPTEKQPLAVVGILRQSGAVAANEAVQALADKSGDTTAAELVERLPVMAIADIVTEYDYTKQSIVAQLMTPRQLRGVVERLPLFGKKVDDTLCAVILSQEDPDVRRGYFRELGKTELGAMLLATAFPVEGFVSFARTGCFSENHSPATAENICFGNWEELLFSLKSTSPAIYKKVRSLVLLAYAAKPQRDLEAELLMELRSAFGSELGTADPYAFVTQTKERRGRRNN